ncbi:hypothetical protein [Butyrivibrio sp. MB2005]|uniref:hypothetical protein n=1 Tax=Butyrivibrio sp. MB2005 TaxID=1280678 RepID=UPI0003F9252E|nr:hypothetical protein [Butyrivibrio sp. MB2005]
MNESKVMSGYSIISLLFLIVVASFHDIKYVAAAFAVLIYAVCYIRNSMKAYDKRLLIPGVVIVALAGIHFVSLWSNLVFLQKISAKIHITAGVLTSIVAVICGVLAINGVVLLLHMIRDSFKGGLEKIKESAKELKKRDNRRIILMCMVFAISMITVIAIKKNYHVDEMLSYGLSNHTEGFMMTLDEGVKYVPSDTQFIKYLGVSTDHRFDYENVFINQENDVHPPLYYSILHTISSLFPGSFSRWYAGIINIVFGLLSLIMLDSLLRKFLDDKRVMAVILCAFVISAGILNAIAYFRMYIVAMFICLLLLNEIVDGDRSKSNDYHFYGKLSLTLLCGALTHYYVTIYAALLFTTFGIILLVKRRFTDVLGIILSASAASLSAIAIFPAMLTHMFGGYRGKEALESIASSGEGMLSNFKRLLSVINGDFLGNLGVVVLVLGVLAGVIFIIRSRAGKAQQEQSVMQTEGITLSGYVLLIVPTALYFFAILKIAQESKPSPRYFYPIYGISFAVLFLLIYKTAGVLGGKWKLQIFAASAIIISISGIVTSNWSCLYFNTTELIEFSKDNSDLDCLVVYDTKWKIPPAYEEIKNFKSVTFVRNDHLDTVKDIEISTEDRLALIVVGKPDDSYIQTVIDALKVINSQTLIGTASNEVKHSLYYLEN